MAQDVVGGDAGLAGRLGDLWRIPLSEQADPVEADRALRERIKELNCLYAITQLAERSPDAMAPFLEGVVRILPPSWQYPEVTCARVVFDGTRYQTHGFRRTKWRQESPVRVHGEVTGRVTVCYTAERPGSHEGPFLREERALIDAVAERIGTVAMRIAAEQELQEINRQLGVERQALQETNAALRTVLSRIEEDKREVYRNIQANVDKVLMPMFHALLLAIPRPQRKVVELLRDHLEDITAPFIRQLTRQCDALTPTEIRICNMIRGGLSSKEIAEIRSVSPATISRHREHIRRKLGIANRAVNLVSHLQATR